MGYQIMAKPTIRIHDTVTGEVIDREMTAAEIKSHEQTCKDAAAQQAEIEKKAVAKSALLAKLGITEDEAKLLLG